MNDESVRERGKEEIEIEKEYERILGNEFIYLDEIDLWKKLQNIAFFLCFIGLGASIIPAFSMPSGVPLFVLFPDYPLQVSSFVVGFVLLFGSIVAFTQLSNKTSKIRNELGLHREERIYLRAFETSSSIDSYLNESNPKRKLHFKRWALQNARELTENVEGWKYGNIRLIANLIGDKIDLLKDNVRRLVLSNVAKGDEETLKKISKILMKLCKYIHSPSFDKLDELNDIIKEIPFKEYKYLTKKEKMSVYFYSRPRMFRLFFASGITITVVAVLLCLEQNLGLAIVVGVPCFWGAFTGFDKIFMMKEK